MVFEKLKNLLTGGEETGPQLRELSVKELRKEIKQRKKNLIEGAEKNSETSLERTSKLHAKTVELIEELSKAEPEEQVHARIYKPTNESKRLMLKRVKRASEEISSIPDLKWKDLIDFNRSLRQAVNMLESALVSHGARVATLFEEEVNLLKSLTEKFREVSQDLNKTLRRNKIKIDELDEISSILSTLRDLKNQERELMEKESYLREHQQEIEKTLEKEEKSLKDLMGSQRLTKFEEIKQKEKETERKKREIRRSIRSTISGISRPMRKMKRIIQDGSHAVGREAIEGLNLYIDNPEEAALSEEGRLPKLEALLKGLKNLMGEMDLDTKERQKRSEKIKRLLEQQTLVKLREKFDETEERLEELRKERASSPVPEQKKELETSIKESKNELKTLQESLENTQKKLAKTREQIKKKTEKLSNLSEKKLKTKIKGLQL